MSIFSFIFLRIHINYFLAKSAIHVISKASDEYISFLIYVFYNFDLIVPMVYYMDVFLKHTELG